MSSSPRSTNIEKTQPLRALNPDGSVALRAGGPQNATENALAKANCTKNSDADFPVAKWVCVEWNVDAAKHEIYVWLDTAQAQLDVLGSGTACVAPAAATTVWQGPAAFTKLSWFGKRTTPTRRSSKSGSTSSRSASTASVAPRQPRRAERASWLRAGRTADQGARKLAMARQRYFREARRACSCRRCDTWPRHRSRRGRRSCSVGGACWHRVELPCRPLRPSP